MRIFMPALVAAVGAVALVVACGGGGATPGPTTVGATEKEFSISLSQTTATPGSVTFNVNNAGTIAHEFVVVDTDTPADQLPVDGTTVNEDALTAVDEIEDIAPGTTPALTVNLSPGHYAIICNIEGHYAAGMHADLTVQ